MVLPFCNASRNIAENSKHKAPLSQTRPFRGALLYSAYFLQIAYLYKLAAFEDKIPAGRIHRIIARHTEVERKCVFAISERLILQSWFLIYLVASIIRQCRA